ncbi:hypothetical protein QTP70_030126 [Hemibagrus guttatus]|uniref:Uncharacterized protein n=1 Tax=Hemibagrus guttatus TaxID=175788 RepID=A0AAE0RCA1_9TELE|nr:hypothetical protein QTP70_030126 [Hemibagrus guttatus]
MKKQQQEITQRMMLRSSERESGSWNWKTEDFAGISCVFRAGANLRPVYLCASFFTAVEVDKGIKLNIILNTGKSLIY